MKATKTFKIRFLALLFSFALIAAHLIALPASAVEETMPVRAYAVYAVHGGELLAAKNAGELIPPASTAKIMSGLLFCEAFLDKGDDSLNNEKLQRKITVTSEMLRGASGRKLGLAAGDVLTLEALLYAAIGGGFPITLAGTGIVGAVACSGLPHPEDHRLLVDCISEMLGIDLTKE